MKNLILLISFIPTFLFAQSGESGSMEEVWKKMNRQYNYEQSDSYQGPRLEKGDDGSIESAPQQLGGNENEPYTGIPIEEGEPISGGDDGSEYEQEGQALEQEYATNEPSELDDKQINGTADWVKTFLTILFIIIVCVAVAFGVYWWIRNRNKTTKLISKETGTLDENPTDISLDSLTAQLQLALSTEDYKQAVRIYLLFALKHLLEKQHVFWKKEKTNYHYNLELKGKPVAPYFIRITRVYDAFWYGAQPINQVVFLELQKELESNYNQLIRS